LLHGLDWADRTAVDEKAAHLCAAIPTIGSRSSKPINKNEEKQPHNVDEMPVPGRRLEPEVMVGREMALDDARQHHGKHDCADRQKKDVEAGQHLERRAVYPRRKLEVHRVAVRVVVLERLQREEDESQDDRREQPYLELAALLHLERVVR